MNKQAFLATMLGTSILMCSTANGHVSASAGGVIPIATKNVEVTLNVPHGCGDDAGNHFDTRQVEITVPAEFTGVRPMDSTFGAAVLSTNEAGVATKITWSKADNVILPADDHLYKFTFRGTLPDKPFGKIFFPTVQFCNGNEGAALTASWTAIDDGEHHHDATAAENPAPALFIYPARNPGWNKFLVNEHVHDFSVFADAEIVWAGSAAYSTNPVTLDLIKADSTVTVLDAIHPGTEIWVKY